MAIPDATGCCVLKDLLRAWETKPENIRHTYTSVFIQSLTEKRIFHLLGRKGLSKVQDAVKELLRFIDLGGIALADEYVICYVYRLA